ncbi:hypothetical protein [Caminibacter sp.]
MKKREFTAASRLRCSTKILLKEKRVLKRLRNKKARQSKNPKTIYKTTSAWNLI